MVCLGSPQPVTRIAWYTYTRPDNGSRIAPPKQVAAPPNGSISVGWLCVSFLNMIKYSSSFPSTMILALMLQALISSDSSRFFKTPLFFNSFATMVATSIKEISFFLSWYTNFLDSIYFPYMSFNKSHSISISSNLVRKVVCLQWSDQYVSIIFISVMVGSLFSVSLKYSWQNFKSAISIAKPYFS